MVILGYFYREAREAASIDAAWRVATEALGGQPSGNKSIGTTAMKSSTTMGTKPVMQPTPSLSRPAASSSYFSSITRQASNLASTVGLSAISDITFNSTSDGSLFEFSEAERQKARSLLNDAAASNNNNTNNAASASSSSSASVPYYSSSMNRSPSERSSTSSRFSPEVKARGRSSSVWSSATSVSSVTQRGRTAPRGDVIW